MNPVQPDEDKIRARPDSIKGRKRPYCRPLPVVAVSLVLLAGILHAQGTMPESSSSPHSFPIEQPVKPPHDTSHFSYAISGLFTIKTEEVRNGFGIGITGLFDRFRPLVPSGSLNIVISSLDVVGLPKADFVIISPALDLTLRKSAGRLRPYAGVGVNLHFSQLVLDEPANARTSVYDSTTQARHIDMGWGVTPHLRVGLIIPVGRKQHIFLEGRFMSVSHNAEVSYRDRYTGNEWQGTVHYRIPSVWISVGIIQVP